MLPLSPSSSASYSAFSAGFSAGFSSPDASPHATGRGHEASRLRSRSPDPEADAAAPSKRLRLAEPEAPGGLDAPLDSPPSGSEAALDASLAPFPDGVQDLLADVQPALELAPQPALPTVPAHDPLHEEALDLWVGETRVVIRACFVDRDIDIDDDANPLLACRSDEGFNGLFATNLGGDLALIVIPPVGVGDGLVFMRHCAITGPQLASTAHHMMYHYQQEMEVAGRFVVAFATTPLWDNLNEHRQEREAAGEALDTIVDTLILEHGLDLPLSPPAITTPGAPPPLPASVRFQQAGEALVGRHIIRAEALAAAFGGSAVELPTPSVFVPFDGSLVMFDTPPDYVPSAYPAPPSPPPDDLA